MPMIKVDALDVEYRREGAGPDLLLLHSLLTDLSVFDAVLPALSHTRRVTLINLPGFGASSPALLGSVADHADHVARTMQVLDLSQSTDVFGNGFGAFVALELAIRHGERFRRLLVADVVPAFPDAARAPFRGMAEKVRGGGMQAVLDAAIGRMLPPAFQAANPDVVAARKTALAGVDAECFARACLALAQLDLQPRLSGIRNPTLVMCGALDQTTPPALAEQVARAIPGAQYREIAGSGHCPMLEQPARLIELIEYFLRVVPHAGRSEFHPMIVPGAPAMTAPFKLRVNGIECEVGAEPDTPLLYVLRNDLGLKGTRFGCGEGNCGACTVLLDGRAVQSCDTPLWSVPGHEITTIEGLGGATSLHPIQQAFIAEQAAQCGYCSNGIMMSAKALLDANPAPDDAQIAAALSRNLCRCGTHVRILRAIRRAAAALRTEAR